MFIQSVDIIETERITVFVSTVQCVQQDEWHMNTQGEQYTNRYKKQVLFEDSSVQVYYFPVSLHNCTAGLCQQKEEAYHKREV
jgi:hypothetical protein